MIACTNCEKLNEATATSCWSCGEILSSLKQSPSALQTHPFPSPNGYQPPFVPPIIPIRPSPAPQAGYIAEKPAAGAIEQSSDPIYCLVCGQLLPPTKTRQVCPLCRVPRSGIVDPNDVTCSSVLYYSGYAVPIRIVNPLQSPHADESAAAFNWGAAVCSTWWAFRNRCWGWAVVCLLNLLLWVFVAILMPSNTIGASIVGVLVLLCSVCFWISKTIYLGSSGNSLATKHGRYADEAVMNASLRKWSSRGGMVGGMALALLAAEIIWVWTR
jgi:hypothetical protein